ncbi:MAG: hypothetical protein U0X87_17815 [Anaerolineales bacterium]
MLASLQPNVVPELIAVDAARGWMLMRYGGEQPQHPLTHTRCESVEPVIIEYARLQMGLAEYVDAILALGVPDHRLAALPALYSQLLADTPSLMIDQEKD